MRRAFARRTIPGFAAKKQKQEQQCPLSLEQVPQAFAWALYSTSLIVITSSVGRSQPVVENCDRKGNTGTGLYTRLCL